MAGLAQEFSNPADQKSILGAEAFDLGVAFLEKGNPDSARVFLGLAALKKHAGAIDKLVELFEQQNDSLAFLSPLDAIHDSGPSLLDVARDMEDPKPYLAYARLLPYAKNNEKMLAYNYARFYASENGANPDPDLFSKIKTEMWSYFSCREVAPGTLREELFGLHAGFQDFHRALEVASRDLSLLTEQIRMLEEAQRRSDARVKELETALRAAEQPVPPSA